MLYDMWDGMSAGMWDGIRSSVIVHGVMINVMYIRGGIL